MQTLSNFLATIFGAGFVSLIAWATRSRRWRSKPSVPLRAQSKVNARNGRGGTQVIVAEKVDGDVHVAIDNSREIVVQNIAASRLATAQAKQSQSQSNETIWLLVAAAILTAGLFVSYHQFLFWLNVGIVLGLLGTLALGVVRASRHRLWNLQAFAIVFEVGLSLVATVWAWVGVATVTWRGSTVGSISERVNQAAMANEPTPSTLGVIVDAVLDPAAQLVMITFQDQTLTMVLTLMAAVVLAALALVMSWASLFDWLAFMGFVFGHADSKRLAKRAYRFEKRGWGRFWAHVIVCAMVIFFATGLFLVYQDAFGPASQLSQLG